MKNVATAADKLMRDAASKVVSHHALSSQKGRGRVKSKGEDRRREGIKSKEQG